MAATLLSFGVEKLWDLIVRESERFKGVDEQFTELKSDLNMLGCYLRDADAKKHTNAMMRNCVEEIKEIVCDAEDIIETFLIKEELGKASGIRKRMRRLTFSIVDCMKLATEIGCMSKRISKVILTMQSFGVMQQSISDDGCSQPLQERQDC
ncbi:putative disease resistance protein RDL6 [Cardamine amara subsp. amara]|uniref:Disease resistance protein RDL6 n=1 Tax=Cardamine amara subsp. amara TaxID=228776 RepID=A0ABD0ZXP0_CARAN